MPIFPPLWDHSHSEQQDWLQPNSSRDFSPGGSMLSFPAACLSRVEQAAMHQSDAGTRKRTMALPSGGSQPLEALRPHSVVTC